MDCIWATIISKSVRSFWGLRSDLVEVRLSFWAVPERTSADVVEEVRIFGVVVQPRDFVLNEEVRPLDPVEPVEDVVIFDFSMGQSRPSMGQSRPSFGAAPKRTSVDVVEEV